jgi:hypothetical protein
MGTWGKKPGTEVPGYSRRVPDGTHSEIVTTPEIEEAMRLRPPLAFIAALLTMLLTCTPGWNVL